MTKKIARKTITLPAGTTNVYHHVVLEILLREALQQTPEPWAEEMVVAYMRGEDVELILRQSKYGKHKQTAFSWTVMKPVPELMPAPQGNA